MESKISKERAKTMDEILAECVKANNIINIYDADREKQIYLNDTLKILQDLGYIKSYASGSNGPAVKVTTDGKMFYETGRFLKQIEEQEENEKRKREHEDIAHKVNEKALRAAKREPWLIAWSFIATVIGIVLAYLQTKCHQ